MENSVCKDLAKQDKANGSAAPEDHTDESQPGNHHRTHSVSISMLTTSIGDSSKDTRTVVLKDSCETIPTDLIPDSYSISKTSEIPSKGKKFYSQPMPKGRLLVEPVPVKNFPNHPGIKRPKHTRNDLLKTCSGKLREADNTLKRKGKTRSLPQDAGGEQKTEKGALPVDRYCEVLEGPELDTLKPSEQTVLPEDKKWPFLLRYPLSSFGICLGVSSQAIMWKALAISSSTKFLHISLDVNLVLWCISVALVIIVSSIYLLKVILHFEAVRQEYYHPVRINYFFAPWIALLFLALGVPPSLTKNLHAALWYILMTPIFCLELKIYGQWMSGGQRRLSKVANPSNHLSIVGNFVGALLGAQMGLKEGPIFFFSVGFAHYLVLFVTLYQRLPTNEPLPKDLHPVFFLFVAAPSVASMAWARIQGSFDYGSRIAFFIALFLYFSLAVRVNFFRGFKFSLAWWAYTFPMTGAAIATIEYSNEVTNIVTLALAITLCTASALTVGALLVTTIVHACVFRDLFPNDRAIAFRDRKPKHHRQNKWFLHRRNGSADSKGIEMNSKASSSDSKDLEAASDPSI